jgi:tellurite methyltransferase
VNAHDLTPSAFLVENFHLLPPGRALDLAMGQGRNAIYLARQGLDVHGVDLDAQRVAQARDAADELGVPIRAIVADLEDGTYTLPRETYDVIVVFNYLHRPLFPQIRQALVPGGVIVYRTFTVEQAAFGRPKNPAFLLKQGELQQLFHDWEELAYREGVEPARGGGRRATAGIIARKPQAG